MKAISIKNPHAALIAAGIKNVENRSWSTNFRGWLAVCSSQKPDTWAEVEEALEICKTTGQQYPYTLANTNGHILAVVRVAGQFQRYQADYKMQSDIPSLKFSDVSTWYVSGCIGWVLTDVHVLPRPIPIKGRLGLWTLPPDIERAVREQIATLS